MSGAFSGDQIPGGVTADAFYPKGYGLDILMRAIESLAPPNKVLRDTPEPIWIQRNGHDTQGEGFVTIACPDCFRTFQQVISGAALPMFETSCIFCQSSIHYGIVERSDPAFPLRFHPLQASRVLKSRLLNSAPNSQQSKLSPVICMHGPHPLRQWPSLKPEFGASLHAGFEAGTPFAISINVPRSRSVGR